jgi:putative ABC transport system substrate-binding protein
VDRRDFITIVGGSILAAPLIGEAQQSGKVPRVGFLSAPSRSSGSPLRDSFRQGLRELGWVEGKDVIIDYRWADNRAERLSELAAEQVRLKVDLIFAASTAVAVAAKSATSTIPIVAPTMSNPVELGLIASVARPGGNVTGLSYSVSLEIFSKQLELLKETVPKIRRVVILSNPANPSHVGAIRSLQAAAQSLGLQLQLLEARDPKEIDSAFAAMAKERAGALLVVSDPTLEAHRTRLAERAAKSRLPAMYGLRSHPEVGGLMSYGVDIRDNFRRAATYVDKILRGATPGDLPVEQPTKFEFILNRTTAKALGLTIPRMVLLQANEVIE